MEQGANGATRHRRLRFSWFVGADAALDRTPTEARFYGTLGFTVFVLSLLSGIAMAIAAGYWVDKPPLEMAWLGVIWAVLMSCGIEPLIYQATVSRRRYLPLVLIPRVALSLLLAVQIGEPLVLAINHDAIDVQVAKQNGSAARAAQRTNQTFYDRAITRDRQRIAKIRRRHRSLRARIAHNTFLADCESGAPSCSTTNRAGCGIYCRRYRRLAENARRALEASLPQDRVRLAQLGRDLDTQVRREQGIERSSIGAISKDDGLPARERALAALMRSDPATAREAWFLRLFLLVIDLTPLAIKTLRSATMPSPYEETQAALREHELVDAKIIRERAALRLAKARAANEAELAIESEIQRERAISRINARWRWFRGETIRRRR